MDKIATGSTTDRRDLFGESASRLGMNPAIVEKDFWVCWILKRLFAEPTLKDQMVFKGGTSLSKVFGLIDRFSEDIDLILDWRLLGYGHAEGNDPYRTVQSKTKRSRYNQEMNAKAAEYIRGTLLGQLNRLLALVPNIAASIDESDPHTVNVRYPAAFTASYIRPEVRLEIGPLASWVPSHARTIQPYAATSFPRAFAESDCAVVAIDAERTFWEKATSSIRKHIGRERFPPDTRATTATCTSWRKVRSRRRHFLIAPYSTPWSSSKSSSIIPPGHTTIRPVQVHSD